MPGRRKLPVTSASRLASRGPEKTFSATVPSSSAGAGPRQMRVRHHTESRAGRRPQARRRQRFQRHAGTLVLRADDHGLRRAIEGRGGAPTVLRGPAAPGAAPTGWPPLPRSGSLPRERSRDPRPRLPRSGAEGVSAASAAASAESSFLPPWSPLTVRRGPAPPRLAPRPAAQRSHRR
jgi:hypothetical protein